MLAHVECLAHCLGDGIELGFSGGECNAFLHLDTPQDGASAEDEDNARDQSAVNFIVAPVSVAVPYRYVGCDVLVVVEVAQVADRQVGCASKVAHDVLDGGNVFRAEVVGKAAEVCDGEENVWS
jgi:hypothetical protein